MGSGSRIQQGEDRRRTDACEASQQYLTNYTVIFNSLYYINGYMSSVLIYLCRDSRDKIVLTDLVQQLLCCPKVEKGHTWGFL